MIGYFMEQNKNIRVTRMPQKQFGNTKNVDNSFGIYPDFLCPPPNIQEMTNMKHKGVSGDKSRGF